MGPKGPWGVLPDLARAVEVVQARGGALGREMHLARETDSTNDDAKQGAREGAPHGAVWAAEAQRHGRGRQGRAWHAAPGEALLFSVLLRIPCAPARVPPLSLVAGLAVRDAVARVLPASKRALVKWPNDVLVEGKKVAGILVESAARGSRIEYIVVGIGVNVHTRAFPDAIAAVATSLAREASEPSAVDRAEILADILANLDHDVEHVAHRGLGLVHARLVAHDALSGRSVTFQDGDTPVQGTACGIDADGRLLVRRSADGVVVHVAAGEIAAGWSTGG